MGEEKERDLLQDIESIANAKDSVELAMREMEEYHNKSMVKINDDLIDIQSKMDVSQQNEVEMQNEIIELKSATENLQLKMSQKTQDYVTMTTSLEEKFSEESSARLCVVS